MRLGNVEPVEEKLFYYMEELNKSMKKQIEMYKEYNDIVDKAKSLVDIATAWKERADEYEKALKDWKSAENFNSNIFNRQN